MYDMAQDSTTNHSCSSLLRSSHAESTMGPEDTITLKQSSHSTLHFGELSSQLHNQQPPAVRLVAIRAAVMPLSSAIQRTMLSPEHMSQ
jgi:hypothetical protein